jgi:hypothetical protein
MKRYINEHYDTKDEQLLFYPNTTRGGTCRMNEGGYSSRVNINGGNSTLRECSNNYNKNKR